MFGGRRFFAVLAQQIFGRMRNSDRSNSQILQIRSFFQQLRYCSKLKLRSFWKISPTKTTNHGVGMIVPTNAFELVQTQYSCKVLQ